MTTGKVLKERRAPRERGRTGSSLTSAAARWYQVLDLLLEVFHQEIERLSSEPRLMEDVERLEVRVGDVEPVEGWS